MAGKRTVEENGHSESTLAANPQKRHKAGYEDWYSWGVDKVCGFLRENDLDEEVISIFIGEQITGSVLPNITEDILSKMDIEPMGVRLKVLQVLKQLNLYAIQTTPPFSQIHDRFKVFNDPIHGHVEMHPLCITIIDTPQFQRLRYIKQLGGCYFVFPGATHNRFEHSLGVAWLAGQLLQALRSRQPQLDITEADILCVTIAGLCHDLGHGPFSHMFDGWFIPVARPGYDWKHEHASVQMFEYLIESNDLKGVFEEYSLDDKDITFIKEQIRGPFKNMPQQSWPYEGRPKEKGFLYEIVANKRNGIDVDKWDYFARDCHHLGINNNFDHKRFMKFARVINVDGQLQICSRDKEVWNLYDMFYARAMLHRRAYQHKTNNIVEIMITEALHKADEFLKFEGKDGRMLKISETIDDMVAYTKLTDAVFHQILHSTAPELETARNILRMVERRQLYKCVGQTQPIPGFKIETEMIDSMKHEIVDTPPSDEDMEYEKLKPEDLVIQLIKMDYGMKDKNPIDNVRFYLKSNPEVPIQVRKDQVSQMLPEQFMEQHLRVYCKKRDEASVSLATQCFNRWCNQHPKLTKPKGGDVPMDMTPIKLSQGSQQESFTTPQKTGVGQRSNSFQSRLSF